MYVVVIMAGASARVIWIVVCVQRRQVGWVVTHDVVHVDAELYSSYCCECPQVSTRDSLVIERCWHDWGVGRVRWVSVHFLKDFQGWHQPIVVGGGRRVIHAGLCSPMMIKPHIHPLSIQATITCCFNITISIHFPGKNLLMLKI